MAAFFTENRGALLTGAFLTGLAIIALTWFFASLVYALWNAGEVRLAIVVLGATSYVVIVLRRGDPCEAWDVANRAFRRIRGGLGMATVGANSIFAAITGISIASAAVFAKVAVPEMVRIGHSPRFAAAAAFLIFRRAARRCFVLAMIFLPTAMRPPPHCDEQAARRQEEPRRERALRTR